MGLEGEGLIVIMSEKEEAREECLSCLSVCLSGGTGGAVSYVLVNSQNTCHDSSSSSP